MLDRVGLSEDYQKQVTSYMKASGRKKTLFIFYCKDTSHFKEIEFHYQPEIFEDINFRFSKVINSTKERLPNREYAPLKSGALPWQCNYCAYTKLCWPDYELKFSKDNKPQYVKRK